MASRSLGTLTLDLIARTVGFQTGMSQAARIADTSSRQIEKSFSRIGTQIKSVLGGLSVGLLVHKIVDETSKAQAALSQLNAVLKSTGGAAGFTAPQLVKLSKEIQNTTTFSDEAAIGVETILLQFNRLSGPEFKRAVVAVTDIAARLGKDLQPTALIVGKALGGTAKGVEALRKAGVTFSKDQLQVIKRLQETGQAAEVQRIVLAGIEKAVGGSAAALRNTLGGALAGLKNSFGDVFELDTGQTAGLVSAINLLAENLGNLAQVAIRTAAVYAVFRASLVAVEVTNAAKSFFTLFKAVASGNAVLASAESLQAAKAIADAKSAQATAAVTAAEVERTSAMVAGTRATVARIVADEESTATAAVRATVIRNAAGAEAALAAATTAHTASLGKVVATSGAAAAAQVTLTKNTSRAAGAFSLLLAPFRGIIGFVAANPFTAIAGAIAVVLIVVTGFRDKIEDLQKKLADPVTADDFSAPFRAIISFGGAVLNIFDSVKATLKETLGLLSVAEEAQRALGTIQFSTGRDRADAAAILKDKIDRSIRFAQELLRSGEIDKDIEESIRQKIIHLSRLRQAIEKESGAGTTGGPIGRPRGRSDAEATGAAGDDAALEKIRDMVDELRKQNIALDEGSVAAIKFRLEFGDLKDLFKKAGPEAEQYRQVLIDLTVQHEKFQKQLEAKRASEQASKELKDLIVDLETQIATYDKGEAATTAYSLAHGELAKKLALVGDQAEPLRKKIEELNAEIEKQKIAKQLESINLEILRLRGNTAEAIVIQFDIEHKELKESLSRTGDTAGLQQLENLRELTLKQAEFNKLREEASRIEDALATQEERIHNSQEVGALTELEALGKIGDARGKTAAQLDEILIKMEAIAKETGNQEMLDNVDKFKASIESLQTKVELVAQKINGELKESFSTALGDWVKGTKSFGDTFTDMLKDIQNKLIDLIAQNYIEQLFKGMGGSGSGGGGWGGAIASLFGFEKGGYLAPGKMGVAGEKGKPEIVHAGRLTGGKDSKSLVEKIRSQRSAIFGLRPEPGKLGVAGRDGKAQLIFGGKHGLTIINNKESKKLIEKIHSQNTPTLVDQRESEGVSSEKSQLTVLSGKESRKLIERIHSQNLPALAAHPEPGRMGVAGKDGKAQLVYGGNNGLTIINNRESSKLVKLMKDSKLFSTRYIPKFATGGYLPPKTLGIAGDAGSELIHVGRPIHKHLSSLSMDKHLSMTSMLSDNSVKIFRLLQSPLSSLPSRDFGGRGFPGKPVMIGTGAQPEAFIPQSSGSFVPNADLMKGEQTNNFYFTVQAPNGKVSRSTEQQVAAAAARGVADAARRNN